MLAGVLLASGCVGHLEFDPRVDAGASTPTPNNNQPSNNNGTGNSNGGNGTGGQMWGTGGASGQLPSSGTGGDNGYPGTGGAAMPMGGTGGAVMPMGGTGGTSVVDAGGTGNDGGGTVLAATCPTGFNVVTAVFGAKCGGCHSATAPTKNLDLVTAGIAARMINKISTCNNEPLIANTLTAGKPTGLLFEKLAGKVTGCGSQMPAGGAPLSDSEIACVNDWAVAAVNKAAGK